MESSSKIYLIFIYLFLSALKPVNFLTITGFTDFYCFFCTIPYLFSSQNDLWRSPNIIIKWNPNFLPWQSTVCFGSCLPFWLYFILFFVLYSPTTLNTPNVFPLWEVELTVLLCGMLLSVIFAQLPPPVHCCIYSPKNKLWEFPRATPIKQKAWNKYLLKES